MNNYDDVTFIIPIKIDSKDRAKNIYIIVSFLKKFFNAPIIIVEQDNNLCQEYILSMFDNIRYYAINAEDNYIRKCKLINIGICAAETPIVAIQDSDIITCDSQYIESINIVRSKEADCSLPYSHITWQIKTLDFDKVYPDFNFDIIKSLHMEDITPKVYKGPTNGGILFFNKSKIIKAGMYNEKFKGWGNEADEMYHRFGKLGNTYKRADGDLYHLNHYRNPELSGYVPGNREEYIRIYNLEPEKLQKEILTWTQTISI